MSPSTQLKTLLQESGLSEAETAIYLDLLKKPAQNIWDVLTRTKLSKSTAYRAFEKLKSLKMVTKEDGTIKAASLKALVADLKTSERNIGRLAYKIKKIAPFLKFPTESIEVFDQLYTKKQIIDAYLFMSEIDFNVNLELGDFENFVPILGNIDTAMQFRKNRLKHATAHAVCSTFGPYTELFCTREAKSKWKNTVDRTNIDFNKKFVVFSDSSDYVLFNDFEDQENPSSVLIKSKTVADIQRMQFKNFSRTFGNK